MELSYRNNPQSLFRKYAFLVTRFAQSKIGKAYCGIPQDSKVTLLLPNGYHQKSEGSYRATFYPKLASWTPSLYRALVGIDLVSSWIKDFEETQKLLFWNLGLTRQIPALARAVMLASGDPYYPDAHAETTSVDGYAGYNGSAVWATIHDSAGNLSGESDASVGRMPGVVTSNTVSFFTYIHRAIFLFDTSSLPDDATVQNTSKFSIYVTAQEANIANQSTSLVNSTPASNTAVANGDYGNVGTTLQATTIAQANFPNNQYTDFTLNAAGLASVSLTGITKFGLRLESDRANSAPSWVSAAGCGLTINFADAGSNKPKLTIDYADATSTSSSTTSSSTSTTSSSTSTTSSSTSSTSTSVTTTSTSQTTTSTSSTSTSSTTTSTSTTTIYFEPEIVGIEDIIGEVTI